MKISEIEVRAMGTCLMPGRNYFDVKIKKLLDQLDKEQLSIVSRYTYKKYKKLQETLINEKE